MTCWAAPASRSANGWGTTPATEAEVGKVIERFAGSSRQAYLDARRKRTAEAQAEDRAVQPLAPQEECCSEEDIRNRKPRILLTNYRQLEVLTTRLPDVALFADAPLRYLVFDEAHTYSGATGAEVACLIRRVRALAGKSDDEILCIGTSATLSDPQKKDQDNDEAARRFASRFFGIGADKVALVGESYVNREWPTDRYRPAAPPGNAMARLERTLRCLTDAVDLSCLQAVVEELTGKAYKPGADWRESLFIHLVGNDYVFQAADVLKRPKQLDETAWQTLSAHCVGPPAARRTCQRRVTHILGAGRGRAKGWRVAAAAEGPFLYPWPGRDGGGVGGES